MTKKRDYSKTEVKFFIPGGVPHACGHIPNDKVYEYLEKFKAEEGIHKQCNSYRISFWIRGVMTKHGKAFDQAIYIDVNNTDMNSLCNAQNRKKCLRNIKSGKCKDKFVIENIGKVFFADKYKDDNQR